ncbi:MAG: MFS transporter [Ilumatobacter sp.]|uniref:MFS transporter n=1 Tax=Ilumatobacter sp. TaxID=1967498 RepID=UPI00261FE5AD|nr:MFS transporter [Ilumatobacter sp.]MDJ0769798.1 MFS transporter [Ilumatobacter sp.]
MPHHEHAVDSRRAWLTVVAAFASSAVTLGTAYSFGAFFESMSEEFGSDAGETAVIFGVTTWSFFWLSVVTGRLTDRFGPRVVLVIGAVSLCAGLLLTSRVDSIGAGYVTYGAGVGLAAACGYVPMVATVGGWFLRRRAVAVGLAVAGIGAGTMVLSPLSAALIERYGWRDTYVVFGIGGAAVLLACIPLMDRPPGDGGPQPSRFGDALRSAVFRRIHLSGTMLGLALFVPFVFVGQYAKDNGVGSVQAAVLVGVLGGSSVLSRVGFGSLVRRFGSFRLYRTCFAIHLLSFCVWLVAGDSYLVLTAFVLVLGVGYGGFVALGPIVISDRMGVIGLGSILGLLYTGPGLGGLIGPPVAGWLIESTDGYRWAIAGCVAASLAALLLLAGLPVDERGRMIRAPDAQG